VIVVDASALLDAIGPERVHMPLVERLLVAAAMSAPHLVDVEVVSGLRRLIASGKVSAATASEVKDAILEMPIRRYAHTELTGRMWELRHHVSAYDACYIALSEALDAPLVTSDGRLARAPGHRATIELFERPD